MLIQEHIFNIINHHNPGPLQKHMPPMYEEAHVNSYACQQLRCLMQIRGPSPNEHWTNLLLHIPKWNKRYARYHAQEQTEHELDHTEITRHRLSQ